MVTLENEFLKVSINSFGAELASIFNKQNKTEHLWQGDPTFWKSQAPNLFPVVGGCLDNTLRVGDKEYTLGRHGFARHSQFRTIESSMKHAKFSLHFSEETLAVYPYKFEFQVLYDLFGSTLRQSYKVINLDLGTIWFSVGAHPAFNVPFGDGGTYEEYYLEFEKTEELYAHQLSPEGYFTGETRPVKLDGNKLFLTQGTFSKDALVFKNMQSRKVCLKGPSATESICVSYPHFNYLGLWAKPGAPFVCIEPWLGCADSLGKPVNIQQKEGIQCLEHGHVFETDFCIEIS